MIVNKEVFVYIDLNEQPRFVGRLWFHVRNSRESATFEYDKSWLNFPNAFALEPALTLGVGPFHTHGNQSLFGAIGDSAPNRWGRVLMRRFERLMAHREKRAARSLLEIDYLLMVNDQLREGALRFSLQENGVFLADSTMKKIPPMVELPKLLNASERITNESASEEDLRLFISAGFFIRRC